MARLVLLIVKCGLLLHKLFRRLILRGYVTTRFHMFCVFVNYHHNITVSQLDETLFNWFFYQPDVGQRPDESPVDPIDGLHHADQAETSEQADGATLKLTHSFTWLFVLLTTYTIF